MQRYFVMKRSQVFLKLFFLISLTLLFFVVPNFAQSESDAAIDSIHEAFVQLAEDKHFSGSVLIAQHGEILLNEGYGYANLEWEIPNTPDTKFRIYSLTKQFTGMAIVKLQEEGLLNVNDLICDYLDECAKAWQDITIRQLLTNSSGIPDFERLPDNDKYLANSSAARDDIVELFFDEALDFPPGEDWGYSSSGYHLLGLIIEKASGQSYEDFLKDTFFEPLGMDNTGLDNAVKVIGKRAEVYEDLALQTRAQYLNIKSLFSGGGLYSTTEDLYRWQQALFSNAVISQESWDEMMDNAVLFDDPNRYAYGLAIVNIERRTAIFHNGARWMTVTMQFPDEELTIVILSNYRLAHLDRVLPQIVPSLLD